MLEMRHPTTQCLHSQLFPAKVQEDAIATTKENIRILQGLERFHHYCFIREVSTKTDHRSVVTIFKKDVATLSQWLQCILARNLLLQNMHTIQVRSCPLHSRFAIKEKTENKDKEFKRHEAKHRCH